MKLTLGVCMASLLCISLLLPTGGCPQESATDAGTDTASLTSTEEDAAEAAAQASQSLAEALNVSKAASEDDEDQASFDVPEIPSGSLSTTFGTCPEVELEAASDGLLTFDLTIDFGTTGCTPYGYDDYTCTGSASGSFDQQEQNIDLTFESISCNDETLTGTVDATYDIDGQAFSLDGDWDLTYVNDTGTAATEGDGDCSYNASTYVTTITSFDGTVTDTVYTWNAIMTGINVSFVTYGNYIPYSGSMTLSGTTIRTMTVRFDEDSPTTGIVEVSINGAPYFEVDIYNL